MMQICGRYLLWVTLIGTATIVCGEAAASEPTAGFATIQRAFLREDFAAVTTMAQAFLAHNRHAPEAPRVWIWFALSLDRLQRPNEALEELDHLKTGLADNDSLWSEALYWEGDISRRAAQMIRAKLAYQRLLERYPDSAWSAQAQMGLGLIYLQQQAYEMAMGYFHELALRQADTPIAFDALLFEGLCRVKLGQFTEAVAVLRPLLERLREPRMVAQAAFSLGESLTGLKQYDDAARAYHRAAGLPDALPWSQLAQFGLGWAYFQAGRCEESLNAFERYLAPERQVEALFAQGSCLRQLGSVEEALERFRRVLSTAPTHALALESGLAIADADRNAGRLDAAKAGLHLLLRSPLTAVARAKIQLRLGDIALTQGNAPQARTVFELAREVEDPAIRQRAWCGLGDVAMFLGDTAQAVQWYTQAIKVSDETTLATYARYQIGRVRLQLGAWDEAIAVFQRVAGGADAALADDATLALALTYVSQREEDLARSLLEAVRQQRPNSVMAARAGYYLALLALGQNDEEGAQALCQEVAMRAPATDEAVDAKLLLADLLARRTSVDDAIGWLQDAFDSPALPARQRAKLAKRLGDLSRMQSGYAAAIRWYDRATQLLPAVGAEAAYRTASCYEEGGDLELAMRWYGAIEPLPWQVRGQLALARLLERQDRMAEAEAIYERVAATSAPEAKAVEEWLAVLRAATTSTQDER